MYILSRMQSDTKCEHSEYLLRIAGACEHPHLQAVVRMLTSTSNPFTAVKWPKFYLMKTNTKRGKSKLITFFSALASLS